MRFKATGIIPAMITPLTADERVNEKAMRALINHLVDGGVHGIFPVGTTGEFYGLSLEQKRAVFEIAVDAAGGRVPVYGGAGGITTRECIQLVQIAEEAGLDAVSILTPMFISPTQAELITHYSRIASETSLPILLYNNVPKTGVTISPATVVELSAIANIVGIKDSSGDLTLTAEYIRLTRGSGFSVLAGRDTLIYASLCHGGTGAIAACANVAPHLVVDIYEKYMAGDVAGSLEAQYTLAPLRLAFTLGSFPTVIKEALQLQGIDAGPCMGPVGPMTPEAKAQLKQILVNMAVLR
ncbi:MAG: 4-hydroxy-tetrahydrodipicolinate synthase [Spirochaetaceae bacterium]|nr:MAG: 4-hydroxy-tetrahydrodipicolinate synthase [Spirochaetaceae bacterium]